MYRKKGELSALSSLSLLKVSDLILGEIFIKGFNLEPTLKRDFEFFACFDELRIGSNRVEPKRRLSIFDKVEFDTDLSFLVVSFLAPFNLERDQQNVKLESHSIFIFHY